jgi:hypothetical protein
MWTKMCPSSENFVTQRTSTKCGPKYSPHRRTLSCSGLQPNGAQNVPLVGGLCHTADFDQMWPKMCPSLEDFVTQRTLTKCCPKCAPCWRTLSRCGLQPNVAQNVPLIGGLCHAADFDQIWPKLCPSSEDFVTRRTSTKFGPNMCPSMGDFVLLRGSTTYGSTTYSSLKKAGTKQTDSNRQSTQNLNCRIQLQCHVINMLKGICANKPQQRNDGYHIHHATNDK